MRKQLLKALKSICAKSTKNVKNEKNAKNVKNEKNEKNETYTYKLSNEDGDTVIRAYENKNQVGSLLFTGEYVEEDGEHPFGPYRDQPFFETICDHETVVNIQDLKVTPEHRSKGVASELMKRAMKAIKSKYPPNTPVYINATPYGSEKGKSIDLETLIEFYK